MKSGFNDTLHIRPNVSQFSLNTHLYSQTLLQITLKKLLAFLRFCSALVLALAMEAKTSSKMLRCVAARGVVGRYLCLMII
jgi:hypothetical protein